MTTLERPRVATSNIEIVDCPECATPAEVTRRATLWSTHGPVEHIGLRCGQRHVFFMPTFLLADAANR